MWFPVAATDDLADHHVFHGQLLGRELAVWRADDDSINVWENRCPHRGVRLSIGTSDGHELRCRYHGWRFANRTGGSTYMPSHPGDPPAPSYCVRVYPGAERYGLVWASLEPDGTPPTIGALERVTTAALRAIPVNAPAAVVESRLALEPPDPARYLIVQPVDPGRSVIRGVLVDPAPDRATVLAALRSHNAKLSELRDRIEATTPEPLQPGSVVDPTMFRSIDPEVSAPPATFEARVARRWDTAADIVAFELAPVAEALPTVVPGGHIDLHLPNGLVRQYSLVNGPGEQNVYRIGVKREPDSAGGSAYLHGSVREGDLLTVSAPHNNFPLRRDTVRNVLIAGGIGITPLLAMAQALASSGPGYELHVFAQSDAHVAFPEILARLGGRVHRHLGRSPAETATDIEVILGAHSHGDHVAICGPGPMLNAARALALRLGWPDDAVHYEYFKNSNPRDDSAPFEVELRSNGAVFVVPGGRSLLEELRGHGVDVSSSCEQGACGTCLVTVLDGGPDHQDAFLNATERARGDRMLACVSRARTPRLVLDL